MDVASDSSFGAYVMRTADSLQQTGVNIGTNSATPPQAIVISGMTFTSVEDIDLVLVSFKLTYLMHKLRTFGK